MFMSLVLLLFSWPDDISCFAVKPSYKFFPSANKKLRVWKLFLETEDTRWSDQFTTSLAEIETIIWTSWIAILLRYSTTYIINNFKTPGLILSKAEVKNHPFSNKTSYSWQILQKPLNHELLYTIPMCEIIKTVQLITTEFVTTDNYKLGWLLFDILVYLALA